MSKELRFDGKVAIVTGAGNGLGRSHALLLAARGAQVVVNDLGGSMVGSGQNNKAADLVVAEIQSAGGTAVANYDSVVDGEKIVETAMDSFGSIDIVVNNAGILRDSSFAKMTEADWDLIYQVHVKGAYKVTAAAWPHMREQRFGRILMTASAAGIYGNFGQANYSMAKLGLTGFANTLALEGKGRNILSNTIAPLAGSRLTETVLPEEIVAALKPEYVSPLVAWLCHEDCLENGSLFEVGGGFVGKLRWQRSAGRTYRLGREMRVEDMQRDWPQITDFESASNPSDIASSMQPIMENIQAGPSKGGNSFVDVDLALGYEFESASSSYDERDLSLYALGVGAGEDPADEKDLQLIYEMHGKGFRALPSYAVIPAVNQIVTMAKEGKRAPGLNFGIDRLLHGEQYTEIVRPLPTHATLRHESKVKSIYDKGKNALVTYETKSYDEAGELLIVNELTAVIRGAGGWGGERGPSEPVHVAPSRPPDLISEQRIHANQALLYRLSGDWNPLHVDPGMAKAFGFEKPILHGLCTFGHATRHVINQCFPDADPRYFKSIKVRFADSVFPGETLVTEMWKEGEHRVIFRCKVKERDSVVISNAAIERFENIPRGKAKPAKKEEQEEHSVADLTPLSVDVFSAISDFIAADGNLCDQVQTVFQFQLTDPASVYTVDLQNAPGSCEPGQNQSPGCTLTLSDSNFMDMCTGKADAQKLYFGGQLKIAGNVMASQKLTFLQSISPRSVQSAAKARVAGSGASEKPSASGEPQAADVFVAIADFIERNPEKISQIGVVYQFQLSDPDSVWTVDMKNGQGSVAEGQSVAPECTLSLSNADFMGMTSGDLDAQKLFFSGKLKVSGNVMASQKLTFLQEMDPEQAKAAVLASRAKGKSAERTPVAAASQKTASALAPAVFEKLATLVAEDSELAKGGGAKMQWEITEPAGHWALDFSGPASVVEGSLADPEVTFTISDANISALASGKSPVQKMYQEGKLRVDGDIAVAQTLDIFPLRS